MDKEQRKKLIVLVEDEEIIVNLLTNKLKKVGYEVKAAYDGINGLNLIRTAKPDLVLLDMLLPRLNGFEVLEKLNKEKILPDLPVIVISNSGQPIEIDRVLKLGIRDYLVKINFEPNEIIAKVNRVLGRDEVECGVRDKIEKERISGQALLVEDDIFISDLLEKKLSQSHIKTFRTMDANSARLILTSEKIDVILLDIVLPGVNGIEFLKEIKANEKLKHIPVIILSNLGQKKEIEKGLKAGAEQYMIKAHSTPNEIISKVMEVINKLDSRI